jgi:hypothetical protein
MAVDCGRPLESTVVSVAVRGLVSRSRWLSGSASTNVGVPPGALDNDCRGKVPTPVPTSMTPCRCTGPDLPLHLGARGHGELDDLRIGNVFVCAFGELSGGNREHALVRGR